MTKPRKPTAPADLAARGRAFWRRAITNFELSEVETELLRECCRLLDECESLRSAVEVDGTTVARWRRPPATPAVSGAPGELVLPAELTIHRPGDRRTVSEFSADQRR